MKKFKQIAEQHREKGRFRPTVPRNVSNVAAASPRPSSDSANVRLKEASAAAIAAATAISKKKSGNYDKEGMRVKPYKNPEHPKRKSNEQRRREINEYLDQQDPAELKGTSSGALTMLDKPNKEPMRKYKEMKINELSNELLHRYKEKAAIDASKADREGNFERGNKRFSGVVKATNKQFANFKKKGFREESEVNEAKDDKREYDYEGEMVKSDLRSIIANANRLIDMLEDDDNLPEWCQNKVTLAEDYISTVANYMTAEMNEEVEYLEEKNKPTNPELWARAKALAKSKFDVYPSAYANGWASKWYKSKGGGWRSVSEEIEHNKEEKEPPFTAGAKTKDKVVPGKYGKGYSTARHLARMAMKQQTEKMKKAPIKEESKKAAIVKNIMKKKNQSEDAFQKDPEMSSTLSKNV